MSSAAGSYHLPIFFQQQDEQLHGNAFELQRSSAAA
jgi:hypothetical protein